VIVRPLRGNATTHYAGVAANTETGMVELILSGLATDQIIPRSWGQVSPDCSGAVGVSAQAGQDFSRFSRSQIIEVDRIVRDRAGQ
jgi:hypothetical protein